MLNTIFASSWANVLAILRKQLVTFQSVRQFTPLYGFQQKIIDSEPMQVVDENWWQFLSLVSLTLLIDEGNHE